MYYDISIDHEKEYSFKERIGEPEEFEAALGGVVESFSFLEESLCNVISILLEIGNEKAELITSELSFKNLVNLFSSLFKYRVERGDFQLETKTLHFG